MRDRDHGFMLNYTNNSTLQRNRVTPMIDDGPEKCVFIYNANFNELLDNHFQDCQIGIHQLAVLNKGDRGSHVALRVVLQCYMTAQGLNPGESLRGCAVRFTLTSSSQNHRVKRQRQEK